MKQHLFTYRHLLAVLLLFGLLVDACGGDGSTPPPAPGTQIPPALLAIMNKATYSKATWGLRVVDLASGQLIYDREPEFNFHIASVRKLFSVGLALDTLGADHKFSTPVHRNGTVAGGVLNGDLDLVASGDLTLGGRNTPEGTVAFTNFDHTEANSLGSAILTPEDPLAGLNELAQQVAAAGITTVAGDVVIDDRLFIPFNFRGEFDVQPIVVNDDLVDVTILPTTPGQLATVEWRPQTAALTVISTVTTVASGGTTTVTLSPTSPGVGDVTGTIAVDFAPPLPGVKTLVQTFRVTDPASFSRTAFIEALQRAGITVTAPPTGPNPVEKLPPSDSYTPANEEANLVSLPYSEYAKLILKVSHNLGADLSLMYFGLAKGVNSLPAALGQERATLTESFGLHGNDFNFIDGSGGGETLASTKAVLRLLQVMSGKPAFDAFFDALPKLAEDGSLAEVTGFESDPSLAGAKGNVHAKTGTYIVLDGGQTLFKGQAFAGYIDAKSGRRLIYALCVDNAGVIKGIPDILEVFNDEGTISAFIWKDN